MRKLTLLLLLFCLPFAGFSQTAASYLFSYLTGTYTTMTTGGGATAVPAILTDDATQTSIPIGFTFSFCGSSYTTLAACSNGFICLSNSSADPYNNIAANVTGAGFLMPFWDDLDGTSATNALYKTTGTAPNRVFTFEWKNWYTLLGDGPTRMQVKLYETTNVIEFWYGTSGFLTASGTIGIANSSTDYQTLPNSGSSPTPSSSTFTTSIATSPVSGQIYRWTPPTPCTGTPTAGTAVASPSTGGAATSFTLSLSGSTLASGLTYQWQSSSSSSGPWTSISGATNSTYNFTGISANTYYQCIVTCTSTSMSSTSTNVLVTYVATPACTPTASSWFSEAGDVTYGVNALSITGYSGSTLSDAGMTSAASGTTGYLDRTSTIPTINFLQGGVYSASATWGTPSSYQELQMWIDYNDDGYFASSEEVTPVSGFTTGITTSPTTFNITIPATATTGVHNMRIRGIWEYIITSLGVAPAHLDPCQIEYGSSYPEYYSGDVVDYKANIISPCPFTLSASNGGPVCPGSPLSLTGTTTAPTYSWTGPSGFSSTALSPTVASAVAGVYTLTGSNGTCTTTATTTVTLNAAPPAPVITPATATICNGGSTSIASGTVVVSPTILTQNFNSGLSPWTVDNTGSATSSSLGPWQVEPNGYTYSVYPSFSSPDLSQFAVTISDAGGIGVNTQSRLISPSFSLVGYSSASLSFQQFYEYFASGDVDANVEISTDGGTTWTTLVNYVSGAANIGTSTSFVTETISLSAYAGYSNCKIRFYYNSTWGYFWAIDNVSITGTPGAIAPPTWTPSTYLYHNSSFTTPYVTGDTATTVYVHPTTVSSPTTINYIATVTNGTCTSSDTSVVTINPGVPAITGNDTICIGTTTTLSDATGLGTWSTSNNTVATVNPSTGVVTGHLAGTDTVYYTVTGCSAFTVVTVNTSASAITGLSGDLCSGGSTVSLSDATGLGSWTTTNASVATVNSSGVVTSHFTGTATISYTLPSGCYATALVTVDSLPVASISGTTSFCTGGSTSLTVTGTPGAVISYDVNGGSTSTVTIGAGGSVIIGTGTLTTGTYTYYLESAVLGTCTNTLSGSAVVTVNPLPGAIGGLASVCSLATITLTDTTSGGTWSVTPSGTASITSGGVLTGGTSGSATVTYTKTATGCYVTTPITVLALPASISGPAAVCSLATVTLTDGSSGSWSVTPSGTASITTGGVVTGGTAGTATVTFTDATTSCYVTHNVTVNALPGVIGGPATVCSLATITMTDTSLSGTWSLTPSGTASITSGGVLTGGTAGTATVTFTKTATSCYVTTPVVVKTLPGTIGGPAAVCSLATITLTDTAAGSWSVTPAATASITSGGVLTGGTAGTATVTFTSTATGCQITTSVAVHGLPGVIGGPAAVCSLATITLTDTTLSGTWSITPSGTASITTGGVVTGGTAGTATATYTNGTTGCYITKPITVNALPAPIDGGPASICSLSVMTMTDFSSPGTWSSNNGSIASIVSSSGVVTGSSVGSTTITYTLTSNGCYVTTPITVNPLPTAISGTTTVCQAATTTLVSGPAGGTWSTDPTSTTASVDPAYGAVTGGSTTGVATITYTLPGTGCYVTAPVTVNAIPLPITGSTFALCSGGNVLLLGDGTPTGSWSTTASSSVASVGSTGAVISGTSAGTATITYTLPVTNCYVTQNITVNPTPTAFTGTMSVCQGATTTLFTTPAGGTWTVLPTTPSVASVGATNGVVTGLNAGIATVSYTMPTGCSNHALVTVNAQPSAITGSLFVCAGGINTTTLHDSTAGGSWSIGPAGAASINALTGVVTGGTAGTATATYTTSAFGCSITAPVIIAPLVPPTVTIGVTPGLTICSGTPVTYTASVTNAGPSPLYVWSINGVITAGTTSYTYMPANGDVVKCWILSNYSCAVPDTASAYVTMTVNSTAPSAVTISTGMGDTVCSGAPVTFTAVTTDGGPTPVYQWWVNYAPAGGSGSTLTYTPVNGDIIAVRVSGDDICATGSVAYDTAVITVSGALTPGVSIVSTSGGPTSCEYAEVTYTAVPVNGGMSPVYHWTVNGTPVGGTGNSYTYLPATGDVLAVTMVSNFPCLTTTSAASAPYNLTVIPIIYPVVDVQAHPVFLLPGDVADTFIATILSGGGSAPTYQWFKNHFPIAGATTNTWIATTGVLNQGDSVGCQVVNTDACAGATAFDWYTVDYTSVSVQHVARQQAQIMVMPNPNNGTFMLKGELADAVDEEVRIEITDMIGQVVYNGVSQAKAGKIQEQITLGSQLANGMYLLNVRSEHAQAMFHFVVNQ